MTPKHFCEKYLKYLKNVNYAINPDDTIDVDGYVDLFNILGKTEKLPVKFGNIYGHFECHKNKLTTLEGCPNYVGGNFDCGKNKLTTLENCPKYIGGDFYCDTLTHHILGNVQKEIYYNNNQRIVI
jgi:hypothetical protein